MHPRSALGDLRLWTAAILLTPLLLSGLLHAEPAPLPQQPAGVAWPTASWPEGPRDGRVDERGLENAVGRMTAPLGRGSLPDTRAVLIVQGGRIVFERYADGFGADSRFHSWSMAKSVTQALIATLVREQKLALDSRAPVPEWGDAQDPRHAITLRNILNMTTGLDNADGGDDPNSFVGRLFFGDLHRDTAHAAASAPLIHDPGTHWAYASSMGSILGRAIADQVGGGKEATLDFMRKELFDPLGVKSLVPEFDTSGTYLGGGFVWASARDWARLGLLYLRDGVWDGQRILPEGWVDFTRTPGPAENSGLHSAHWWVNGTPLEGQFSQLEPEIDAFMMSGNAGQYVILVPDRDLIVVRLGELHTLSWEDLKHSISVIIQAFPRLAETDQ